MLALHLVWIHAVVLVVCYLILYSGLGEVGNIDYDFVTHQTHGLSSCICGSYAIGGANLRRGTHEGFVALEDEVSMKFEITNFGTDSLKTDKISRVHSQIVGPQSYYDGVSRNLEITFFGTDSLKTVKNSRVHYQIVGPPNCHGVSRNYNIGHLKYLVATSILN